MRSIENDFWIVVTEWDSSPVRAEKKVREAISAGEPADEVAALREAVKPRGPIVWEGFLLTEEEAKELAHQLRDARHEYGWVRAVRVTNPTANSIEVH